MRFVKKVVGLVGGGKIVEYTVINKYGEVIHKEYNYIGEGQLRWLFGDEVEQVADGVWKRKEDGKIFIDKNMGLNEMLAIIKADRNKWQIFIELEKMFEERRRVIIKAGGDTNKAYAYTYRFAVAYNDLDEAKKAYEKLLNEIEKGGE